MKTLLLDNTLWDLCLDAAGNLAIADDPYQRAQSVANALKLFSGELWYDTSRGVPYFAQILAHTPPLALFKEFMVRAALTVPNVANADCVINSFEGRTITGQVTFTAADGTTGTVAIQS